MCLVTFHAAIDKSAAPTLPSSCELYELRFRRARSIPLSVSIVFRPTRGFVAKRQMRPLETTERFKCSSYRLPFVLTWGQEALAVDGLADRCYAQTYDNRSSAPPTRLGPCWWQSRSGHTRHFWRGYAARTTRGPCDWLRRLVRIGCLGRGSSSWCLGNNACLRLGG